MCSYLLLLDVAVEFKIAAWVLVVFVIHIQLMLACFHLLLESTNIFFQFQDLVEYLRFMWLSLTSRIIVYFCQKFGWVAGANLAL